MDDNLKLFGNDPLVKDVIATERPWLLPFLVNHHLTVKEFPWGYSVNPFKATGSDPPNSISILIKGFIEIYEEHFVECGPKSRRAYRPIKILEPGDIFGDLELVDQLVFKGKQLPLGEDWGIAYGGRTALFFANKPGIDKDMFVLDAVRRNIRKDYASHFILANTLKDKGATVKVAEFNLSNLNVDQWSSLVNHVMHLSWKKAYTYRLSANSYNIQERFRFLQIAKQQTETMGTNSRLSTTKASAAVSKKKYDNDRATNELMKNEAIAQDRERVASTLAKASYDSRVNYADIIDIFVDSLFDAINRPVRDEPVYAENPSLCVNYDLSEVNKYGTLMLPVRISKEKMTGTFYFPLGLSNFLTCNFVSLFDKANSKARFFEGFGAEPLLPPNMDGKVCLEKGSKSHFWQSVAERILHFHRNDDPQDNVVKRLTRTPYCLDLSIELKKDFNDDFDLHLVFSRKREP